MWTNIIGEADKDKMKRQKIKFLKHKLGWVSYLIMATKKSKLAKTYSQKDVKDILRALESVGTEICSKLEDCK